VTRSVQVRLVVALLAKRKLLGTERRCANTAQTIDASERSQFWQPKQGLYHSYAHLISIL
jgi:hypothetical protein